MEKKINSEKTTVPEYASVGLSVDNISMFEKQTSPSAPPLSSNSLHNEAEKTNLGNNSSTLTTMFPEVPKDEIPVAIPIGSVVTSEGDKSQMVVA